MAGPGTPIPGSHKPPSVDPNVTSDLTILARFELENVSTFDGTKILMIEWETDCSSIRPCHRGTLPDSHLELATGLDNQWDQWDVSWEGKAGEIAVMDDGESSRKRVYFLLPHSASLPTTVSVSHPSGVSLSTKPLPALYPEGLQADPKVAGRRGVLHTLWAKKRIAALDRDIETEMRINGESVGLEIAFQEKAWLVENFGLCPQDQPVITGNLRRPSNLGRLGEKLQGLKVSTRFLNHKSSTSGSPIRTMYGMEEAASRISNDRAANPTNTASENDDDLFALPMSPRSPEMKRSPFSLL